MAKVAFRHFDAEDERRREALLALGNGVLSWRASAPEAAFHGADDKHYAGLYRAGWYDDAPRQVNGRVTRLEALVNLPNPFGMSFSPDGRHWFAGATQRYRQVLDLECPVLRRDLEITLGVQRFHLHEERFLSLCDPTLAVLRWVIEPQQQIAGLHLRTLLDASVRNALIARERPYEGRRLDVQRFAQGEEGWGSVVASLPSSDARVAVVTRTICTQPLQWASTLTGERLLQEAFWHAEGGSLVLERRARVLIDDELPESLMPMLEHLFDEPYDTLLAAHARDWAARWASTDTAISDEKLATPLHLNILHVLQNMPPPGRTSDQGLPPRGWHEGYFGQIFWDEMFAFTFLASRFPDASQRLLEYRHRRLPAAHASAKAAGYVGAMFPWRSARSGTEQTPPYRCNPLAGHWMADHSCLQRHIGAAIVFDVWQQYQMTGDLNLLATQGGELIVEVARFWASIVVFDEHRGRYVIRGVVGPDEYHNAYPGRQTPGLDNNAYTNCMAAWTLCRALDLLAYLPRSARLAFCTRLNVHEAERARWADVSRRMYLPFLQNGVLNQFDGYETLLPAGNDWLTGKRERLDWWLDAQGDCSDRYQLTKQADVLTLLYLFPPDELSELCAHLGYAFDEAAMRRTAQFHMARITHESSLSKMICAGALAHLDPDASWKNFCGCLRTDLQSPAGGGTQDGVHLGAMAGALDVLQRHYLGIYPRRNELYLHPAAPPQLDGVTLGFRFHGQRVRMRLQARRLTLELAQDAAPLDIRYRAGTVRLAAGEHLTLDCP